MEGPIGTIIDVLSVFATVVGVAVSLGMGALQINGGLHYLFGVPNNVLVQSIIIVVVTILFLASAWSGLSKGIQYLSNLNIGLGTVLMIIALIVGPAVLILNMFTSSTGSLLNTFLFNSFDTAALNGQNVNGCLHGPFMGLVVKLESIRRCIYCTCLKDVQFVNLSQVFY